MFLFNWMNLPRGQVVRACKSTNLLAPDDWAGVSHALVTHKSSHHCTCPAPGKKPVYTDNCQLTNSRITLEVQLLKGLKRKLKPFLKNQFVSHHKHTLIFYLKILSFPKLPSKVHVHVHVPKLTVWLHLLLNACGYNNFQTSFSVFKSKCFRYLPQYLKM